MNELSDWLHWLAREATVHLLPLDETDGVSPPQMWGSGFFVAPGWVLTAAHVLRRPLAEDRELVFAVRGGSGVNAGMPVPARLEGWLLADPRMRDVPPAQDLALVRLLDQTVEHQCVWLVDRAVQHSGAVMAYGYRPGEEDGLPGAVPWSSDAEINVHDGRYGLRFKPDVEFPNGVSGGPLLDPRTGAVVALIKSRRLQRDGGMAVSVAALRRFGGTYQALMSAHDGWHGHARGPHTWVKAQDRTLAGSGDWTPGDRGAALSRLAALPAPPDGPTVAALALLARSGNQWPRETPELHTWRDGHGLLFEGVRSMDALTPLRYLQLVALYVDGCGGDAGPLGDWVQERLSDDPRPFQHAFVTDARLPERLLPVKKDTGRLVIPYPGPGQGPTVAVLLDPVIGSEPTHFFWQIWIDNGHGESEMYADDSSTHGHRPGDLVQALRASLTEVFHTTDRAGCPVPLEVALPPEYFDMAVHRWRLDDIAALDDLGHLGTSRRVVLRSLARRGEPDNPWSERWQAVITQKKKLTPWRVPEPGVTPSADRFHQAEHSAVPVICRSVAQAPGRTVLRLALESGHGIALWQVDGHTTGACAESCDELHTKARWLFESLESVEELPDLVRGIRQEISMQRADRLWAEPLALLYDDPRRPLPAEDTAPLDSPL